MLSVYPTLTDASNKVGLEENKYMFSRQQNAGQNHDIKIANKSFENVAQLEYFGTKVINQHLIQEEIRRRFVCLHVGCLKT
jgi:hypothetical protein